MFEPDNNLDRPFRIDGIGISTVRILIPSLPLGTKGFITPTERLFREASDNQQDKLLVWFQLVDAANGQPYKGTTSSSIIRSSLVVPVVDQFREAVHSKNAKILTDIASSQLLVYKNKSAFDKRNADDGKEVSLEPICSIGLLGSYDDPLIVVVPLTEAASRLFSMTRLPITAFGMSHGGVPLYNYTKRKDLVTSIMKLMFPIPPHNYLPFLLFRSPPMSGKSGLFQLLHNAIVLREGSIPSFPCSCNRIASNEDFSAYFLQKFGISFNSFLEQKEDRVLLIDEAQTTYNDSQLWTGPFKDAVEYRCPGLRVVVFTSFGSYDMYRDVPRSGTPIVIPDEVTFRLFGSPGLVLKRDEFDEMIQNSLLSSVSDLAWQLCSGHIGIARAMIEFIKNGFSNSINVTTEHLTAALLSLDLLEYIKSQRRGIPTMDAFRRVLANHENLSDEVKLKMVEFMDKVAYGAIVNITNLTNDSEIAASILAKFGFLHETRLKQLAFASQMHLKIWLQTQRTQPLSHLLCDIMHTNFIDACIQRMSATRLLSFAADNHDFTVRERQIQMELYRAAVSCLDLSTFITPEWRTPDGKGYIDLVIQGKGLLWFWELLFDGDDAKGHHEQLLPGGMYYSSMTDTSRYALIDFRQNREVKRQRDSFVYVTFDRDYKKAFISGRDGADVELVLQE